MTGRLARARHGAAQRWYRARPTTVRSLRRTAQELLRLAGRLDVTAPAREHRLDRPPGYPAHLERTLTLADGRSVDVRPIVPEDESELRRAVTRADLETVRLRFLGGRPPSKDEDFAHLVTVDYHRRVAFVAFSSDGRGVGLARYEATDEGDVAEVAIAVDPAWRGVGLATALLRLLARAAVENGIRHLSFDYFADNAEVAGLARGIGLPMRRSVTGDVVTVEATLPRSPRDRRAP